nr:hypothetical protein [Tanacetum cinerariifolium]
MSSSYGRKQFRIPLSPANYSSMHPLKENMLTSTTKNSTAVDFIDKRRAASRYVYTLMNFGYVKESYKSNSEASRKIDSTNATPSAHSTPKRCATPAKTPSKLGHYRASIMKEKHQSPLKKVEPDFDIDIKADVEEECSNFGKVKHIHAFETFNSDT